MIGHRIKKIREERGLSVKMVSIDTGIGMSTIYDAERGNTYPSCDTAITLSKYYEVSLDYLLGNTISNDNLLNEIIKVYFDLDSKSKQKLYAQAIMLKSRLF